MKQSFAGFNSPTTFFLFVLAELLAESPSKRNSGEKT
jgi:hypothetical protein